MNTLALWAVVLVALGSQRICMGDQCLCKLEFQHWPGSLARRRFNPIPCRARLRSLRRREAADRLRAAVESVLSDLAMGGSQFAVRMSWTPLSSAAGGSSSGSSADLSSSSLAVGDDEAVGCSEAAGRYRVRPSGLDVVEFLFAAGQGEPLRPLSAVASGGESARVMLALKAAPAFMAGAAAADEADGSEAAVAGSGAAAAGDAAAAAAAAEAEAAAAGGSQILVLDEIDSGIGSRLGQPVGRILRRMAAPGGGLRVGQILVVSHLPQVGAAGWLHEQTAAGSLWLLASLVCTGLGRERPRCQTN